MEGVEASQRELAAKCVGYLWGRKGAGREWITRGGHCELSFHHSVFSIRATGAGRPGQWEGRGSPGEAGER